MAKIICNEDLPRLLGRGVAEIINEDELVELLRSGRTLRLKEGLDPSSPDLHLGHMVALRKLRQFQELGHQVVLIVGDWTARIGDPSGMSVMRPMLSAEEVKANARTYMDQFFKVVDKERTEIRWQSEWYDRFALSDVIGLSSQFTIAQLLARDDFNQRYHQGKPISIAEILYPLLQAYDSVATNADVEFGGTDQKFNLLLGRELQASLGQVPQQVFLVPLLVGTDGRYKMSKSLKNYIGITEPPEDIYGKVMSVPDHLIISYFELLTDRTDAELQEIRESLKYNLVNPMEIKKRLAWDIVIQLYDKEMAEKAAEHFSAVIQKKEVPQAVPECHLRFSRFYQGNNMYDIGRLLLAAGLVKSRSEALRLINQGAVSIDGNKLVEPTASIESGSIIKVGKLRFVRIINQETKGEDVD